MTDEVTGPGAAALAQHHKRRLRNYLIDIGLQLRYTVFVLAVAVLLTAALGAKIYQATSETSRIVAMTASADPAAGEGLRQQFRANDRVVLLGIAGFGLLLMFSVAGVAIWMTHKVAGPLHNIAATCHAIRDNRLPPTLRHIRKGDMLQGFFATISDMHAALRERTSADIEALDRAVAAIEAQPSRSKELDAALAELREALARKQESLLPGEPDA